MSDSKLGRIEAIAFIVVIILNHIFFNLPNRIINVYGSASLLNIVYISIVSFLILYVLLKLFKKFEGYDILDVSEFLGGKILKSIIGILFIAYFLIMSSTQLRNLVSMLKITYFEEAPECFLLLCFVVVLVISCQFQRSTIFRNNVILTVVMLVVLLLIFAGVSTSFIPERIFPILGYGFNHTFFTGLSNLFAFSGLAFLYFLQPFLKRTQEFKKISYISLGISSIYLFLSVMSLLFTYADVLSTNELSPLFSLVQTIDFSRFFQRPESIFLFGWILNLLSYLSISMIVITTIFQKITQNSDQKMATYTFTTLLFLLALIPKAMADVRWIQNNIFPPMILSLLYVICPIILLLANWKYRKKSKSMHRQGDSTNE